MALALANLLAPTIDSRRTKTIERGPTMEEHIASRRAFVPFHRACKSIGSLACIDIYLIICHFLSLLLLSLVINVKKPSWQLSSYATGLFSTEGIILKF